MARSVFTTGILQPWSSDFRVQKYNSQRISPSVKTESLSRSSRNLSTQYWRDGGTSQFTLCRLGCRSITHLFWREKFLLTDWVILQVGTLRNANARWQYDVERHIPEQKIVTESADRKSKARLILKWGSRRVTPLTVLCDLELVLNEILKKFSKHKPNSLIDIGAYAKSQ